jgi:WD40 repeat protein
MRVLFPFDGPSLPLRPLASAWRGWPLVLAAGLLLIATAGAAAEPAAEGKPIEAAAVKLDRPVDFDQDISPILEANCVACHNLGIAESKLNLETAEGLRKGGKRGAALVPKDPAASLLYQLVSRAKKPAMPPLPNKVDAHALTPVELGTLKQWILEGAAAGAARTADRMQWQPIPAGMKSILSVALSPWGRYVAAGRANQIVVYDVVLGREVARLIDPLLNDIQFEGRPMYPGGAAERDFVHSLAFSPDGSLIAAGGYRVVKVWKRDDVQPRSIPLPKAATALAVSADGSLIAAATADHGVQLISAGSAPPRTLAGPSAPVTSLAFSADGKTLFAGSADRTWRSWSTADGSQTALVTTAAPVGALVLSKDGSAVITAGADGVIRVWPSASKTPVAAPLKELKGHAKAVTSLAVAQGAGTPLVSGSEDGTVRVWDLAAGKQSSQVNHGSPVASVAVRFDGKVMVSAGADKVARVWQVADGKKTAELRGSLEGQRAVVAKTEAQTIAGQHVASADARGKAAEQELKDRQEGVKKSGEAKTAADKALAEAKTKEKAASDALAAAKKALEAKPKDADLKKKADEAEKALAAAAMATKTATDAVASAVRGGEAAQKALVAATQKLEQSKAAKTASEKVKIEADAGLKQAQAAAAAAEKPIRSVEFSADGKLLVTAGDDAAVEIWDAEKGRALEALHGPSGPVLRAFFGAGSTLVAAADNRVLLWETNPGWKLVGRIGGKADAPLDLSESPFVSRVLCLAFNAQGTLLATGGGEPSRSGELKIWNVPALDPAREIKDAHSDTVFGVEFSRDGVHLASAAADKFVKVFDVAGGKLERSFEGHTHHVLDVTWKADGSTLASAGADNQIKVWSLETGEQVRSITGYAKQVTAIQFIGTGDNVVSCGGDKTVRLHRTNDGNNYATFEGGTDFMYSAAAPRDESIVVAGGEDGVLRIWNGSTRASLLTFEPPKPAADPAQASAAKR